MAILDKLFQIALLYNSINQKNLGANINKLICNNNSDELYSEYYDSSLELLNFLIKGILENEPRSDIIITEFNNIKTKLFPYQINNLNWMLNIENKNYPEEYNNVKHNVIRGGGLFDEVGMGKTLQIITLTNINKSKYTSLIKDNKLYSKATLIIIPNHLCMQWVTEYEKHTEKPMNIIKLITKHHYNKYTYYELMNADIIICNANFFINCEIDHNSSSLNNINILSKVYNKYANLFDIYWHRVVIDEYHEMESSKLFNVIKFLQSDYRWILSGTPFKENNIVTVEDISNSSLSIIMDYLSYNNNIINKIDYRNIVGFNYIKYHFSRNLHKNNVKILQLPEIKETVVWLKFTQTEQLIYNGRLSDSNNGDPKDDVFLRQICCHPLISDTIRENMTNKVGNLQDVQTVMNNLYLKEYNKAKENLDEQIARCSRLLDEKKDYEEKKKTELKGYQQVLDDIVYAQNKRNELLNIFKGKEKTVIYYRDFVKALDDVKNIIKEECIICMGDISENDIGITKCGHVFCYSCISEIVKADMSKCASCNKKLCINDIFYINNGDKELEESSILGTKLNYIINYIKNSPSKYRIIFSQWDYLLRQVGKVLSEQGIKNLYCNGHTYQKGNTLRLFNTIDESNEYRVILLSSKNAVSGTNLTNAEEVIFLDPIYGDAQYRFNTERQAIGRVQRLGNMHKTINILRLYIKNSVEEDIVKSNEKR